MIDAGFDITRTAALGDLNTDEGRASLVEIFTVYFDNVSAACAAMRNAASVEEVRRQAHRARGASGIIGAVGLSRMFADLEVRAAAGECIPHAAYDEVEAQLAALRRAVSSHLGRNFT